MDYVRHGEIQGRYLGFFTMSDIVHCLKYFLELLSGNSATNTAIADGEGGQLATFSRISIGSRR